MIPSLLHAPPVREPCDEVLEPEGLTVPSSICVAGRMYIVVDPPLSPELVEAAKRYVVWTPSPPGGTAEDILDDFLAFIRRDRGLAQAAREAGRLLGRLLYRYYFSLGVLEPAMADDEVSDMYVSSSPIHVEPVGGLDEYWRALERTRLAQPSRLHVFRGGVDYPTNVAFSPLELPYLVRYVARRAGKDVTVANPLLEGTINWPRPYRVEGWLYGDVGNQALHMRRVGRPVSLCQLADQYGVDAVAALAALYHDRRPLIVLGPMGSGKTTLAAGLLYATPPNTKVVIIEDVDELRLPAAVGRVAKVTVRGWDPGEVATAVRTALRMGQPGATNVAIAEVRARDELVLLLNMFRTGHGGLSTAHAGSVADFVDRLRVWDVDPWLLRGLALPVIGVDGGARSIVEVGVVRVEGRDWWVEQVDLREIPDPTTYAYMRRVLETYRGHGPDSCAEEVQAALEARQRRSKRA